MTIPEVKPCEKCGEKPAFLEWHNGPDRRAETFCGYQVQCCGDQGVVFMTAEEAAKSWNAGVRV